MTGKLDYCNAISVNVHLSRDNLMAVPSSGAAAHGLGAKCRSPPANRVVKNWGRIGLIFKTSIVSAVKICKRCLQTATGSGSPPYPLPNFRPWSSLGTADPQIPWAIDLLR